MKKHLILAINPGSTSTKLAIFQNEEQLFKKTMQHEKEQLATVKVTDQLSFRTDSVYQFLKECGISTEQLDIIACRGGQLAHIGGGTYKVTKYMRDLLTYAPHSQHASNLACLIGYEIAKSLDIPLIISDSPSADELDGVARILGLPQFQIIPGSHVLNSRMACRKAAAELGKEYEDCRFICLHLGGGVTANVHRNGQIIDMVNSDMGPMSPERAGRIPSRFIVTMSYSGQYTEDQLRKILQGGSGVLAHLGTQDMFKVEQMVTAGDKHATEIIDAMAYQCAKAIGELSTVLIGDIDAIVITGSLAKFAYLTENIVRRVSFLAPVQVIAGEFEMQALARAACRVLDGLDIPKEYTRPPYGFESIEQFYSAFPDAM